MNKRIEIYVLCIILGILCCIAFWEIDFKQKNSSDKVKTTKECCVEIPEYHLIIIEPDDLEQEAYFDSLELLAICVEAEAGNHPLDGRRMVADVILNRVDNPDFPDTIEGVISQPYHFSSYWDGGMDKVTEPSELTIKAVQMELQERGYPGLLYFKEGGYSTYGTPYKKIGDHYFSL